MCDHNNPELLKLQPVQRSDGNVRYDCLICNQVIVKNVGRDQTFNRTYKRVHNLCVDHNDESYKGRIPTYIDTENGSQRCCNWCGSPIQD